MLQKSLPAEWFPVIYDLNGFMSIINRHLYVWVLPKHIFYVLSFIFVFFVFLQLHTLKWMFSLAWSESQFNPLNTNPTNWSNTLKQLIGKLLTNCLSVFDHFVGLVLKGLKYTKIEICKINYCENKVKLNNTYNSKNNVLEIKEII